MAEIEQWLLTTIPGVILLGAVGSLIAVGLLKAMSVALTSWFPRAKGWVVFQKNLELIPHAWVMGSMSRENNIPVLLVYFTFRLMKFMSWLFVSTICFIAYMQLALAKDSQPISSESAIFLVFFFAGFYLAVKQVRIIRIMYDQEVLPHLHRLHDTVKSAGVKKE